MHGNASLNLVCMAGVHLQENPISKQISSHNIVIALRFQIHVTEIIYKIYNLYIKIYAYNINTVSEQENKIPG